MDGFTIEVESWEDNEVDFGDEMELVLDRLESRWTPEQAWSIVEEFGWNLLVSNIDHLDEFVPAMLDPIGREVLVRG